MGSIGLGATDKLVSLVLQMPGPIFHYGPPSSDFSGSFCSFPGLFPALHSKHGPRPLRPCLLSSYIYLHQKDKGPPQVRTERWLGGNLFPGATTALRCGQAGSCPRLGLRGPSTFEHLPQNVLILPPHLNVLSLPCACVGHGFQKPVPQNFLSPTLMT